MGCRCQACQGWQLRVSQGCLSRAPPAAGLPPPAPEPAGAALALGASAGSPPAIPLARPGPRSAHAAPACCRRRSPRPLEPWRNMEWGLEVQVGDAAKTAALGTHRSQPGARVPAATARATRKLAAKVPKAVALRAIGPLPSTPLRRVLGSCTCSTSGCGSYLTLPYVDSLPFHSHLAGLAQHLALGCVLGGPCLPCLASSARNPTRTAPPSICFTRAQASMPK